MARIDDVWDLAVNVMGWQAMKKWCNCFEIKHPTRGRCYWWEGSRNEYSWDPYTDANAALEVVQAMENRGYSMSAEKTKDGWYARFVLVGDYSWNSALELSFCEAICAAALAAIREGQ